MGIEIFGLKKLIFINISMISFTHCLTDMFIVYAKKEQIEMKRINNATQITKKYNQ